MSFCTKCGQELASGHQFCPNCGAPALGTGSPVHPDEAVANQLIEGTFGKAIAAVVCSSFPIASIVAIVLGNQTLQTWKQAKALADRGGFRLGGKSIPTRIMALVGKFTGIAITPVWAIYFVAIILAIIFSVA